LIGLAFGRFVVVWVICHLVGLLFETICFLFGLPFVWLTIYLVCCLRRIAFFVWFAVCVPYSLFGLLFGRFTVCLVWFVILVDLPFVCWFGLYVVRILVPENSQFHRSTIWFVVWLDS